MPTIRERRRRGFQWPVIVFLVLVWNLLWGNISVANVLSGLVISILVVAVFPLPPIPFDGRPRPLGLIRLVFWFIVDLVAASVQVAWLAVRRGPPPRSAVLQVDLLSDSDLYMTMTAEFVSLVPGSVIVDVRRSTSTLFVHIIDVSSRSDVELARRKVLREERRVVEALASDAELHAYQEAIDAAPIEGRPL